ERNFRMRIVRRADIDQVDVLAFDQFTPIRFHRLVAPFIRKCFGLIGATGADRFEHRPIVEIEKIVDLAIRVGVSPAHEAIADHADVQGFHSSSPSDAYLSAAGASALELKYS